jgi:hypothetical protein
MSTADDGDDDEHRRGSPSPSPATAPPQGRQALLLAQPRLLQRHYSSWTVTTTARRRCQATYFDVMDFRPLVIRRRKVCDLRSSLDFQFVTVVARKILELLVYCTSKQLNFVTYVNEKYPSFSMQPCMVSPKHPLTWSVLWTIGGSISRIYSKGYLSSILNIYFPCGVNEN